MFGFFCSWGHQQQKVEKVKNFQVWVEDVLSKGQKTLRPPPPWVEGYNQ